MQRKTLNRTFKILSHQKHMILSSNINEKKNTYRVSLKEFLKLFKCLTSSGIHTVSGWLDLLFKAFHQERKIRKERILTRLAWVVVVLPLFIDIWYEVFFIKTFIIMSISTNIHKPYVCDPLGPYISLVNYSIDQITPYWSTLINYSHPHID